jgi:competence protein ComEA
MYRMSMAVRRFGPAVVGLSIVAIVVNGLARPVSPPIESTLPVASQTPNPAFSVPATAVVVHVAGAVAKPGLVSVADGARVLDALQAAGGVTPDASLDAVNLAERVVDGSRLYIPRIGEVALPVTTGGSQPSGPLNLNTATVDQLDELPGVGPATAEAIIDLRTERGRFRSVDELLDVPGIGDAKFERLQDQVTAA